MADKPDYEGLINFLMKPFLGSPEDLKTDIEQLSGHDKVWLRVAFSLEDRGRMFGRAGRNIQAIRTVLQATGALYGKRTSLDIYGESSGQGRPEGGNKPPEGRDRRPDGDRRRRHNNGRPSRRQ